MQGLLEIVNNRIGKLEGMKSEMLERVFPCVKFQYKSTDYEKNLIIENKLLELRYIKALIENSNGKS